MALNMDDTWDAVHLPDMYALQMMLKLNGNKAGKPEMYLRAQHNLSELMAYIKSAEISDKQEFDCPVKGSKQGVQHKCNQIIGQIWITHRNSRWAVNNVSKHGLKCWEGQLSLDKPVLEVKVCCQGRQMMTILMPQGTIKVPCNNHMYWTNLNKRMTRADKPGLLKALCAWRLPRATWKMWPKL